VDDTPKQRRARSATAPPAPTTPKAAPRKVKLIFAESADAQFQKQPQKVRNGLLQKLKDFALNPEIGKPLTGQLQGLYRVTYGRLRAIVRSDGENPIAIIVVAYLRREDGKDDAYQHALTALRQGGAQIEDLFAKHLRAYLEENRIDAQRRRSKK
jgi:mRNA-degrading endonuclease RelE of RelBE toxin-antitoxin system